MPCIHCRWTLNPDQPVSYPAFSCFVGRPCLFARHLGLPGRQLPLWGQDPTERDSAAHIVKPPLKRRSALCIETQASYVMLCRLLRWRWAALHRCP